MYQRLQFDKQGLPIDSRYPYLQISQCLNCQATGKTFSEAPEVKATLNTRLKLEIEERRGKRRKSGSPVRLCPSYCPCRMRLRAWGIRKFIVSLIDPKKQDKKESKKTKKHGKKHHKKKHGKKHESAFLFYQLFWCHISGIYLLNCYWTERAANASVEIYILSSPT